MSFIAWALLAAAGPVLAAPAWHAELGLLERDGAAVYVRRHPRTGVPAEHVLTAPEKALLDRALAKIPDASWRAGAASLVLAALAEHGIPPMSTNYFVDAKGLVLTKAGLEAAPGAVLKDPFAGKLFSWPQVPDAPPQEDIAAASARVTLTMAAVQGELSLRDIGISAGKESTVVARSYAMAPFRDASADPVQPRQKVEEPAGEVDGLIRKLPDGARDLLRYVAGVSVKDAGQATAADQTAWQALDLRVKLRVPVLDPKRDVFVGVAGQW